MTPEENKTRIKENRKLVKKYLNSLTQQERDNHIMASKKFCSKPDEYYLHTLGTYGYINWLKTYKETHPSK